MKSKARSVRERERARESSEAGRCEIIIIAVVSVFVVARYKMETMGAVFAAEVPRASSQLENQWMRATLEPKSAGRGREGELKHEGWRDVMK